jgi:hypothetical protein
MSAYDAKFFEERKRAEDEAFAKREDGTGSSLVFRDDADIRPARPIPVSEIEEVVRWHMRLRTLKSYHLAFEVGFKLRCWCDLISENQWQGWLAAHLPQIPPEVVHRYLQLWDNHEQLRNGMRLSPLLYERSLFPDRWKGKSHE